MTKEELKKFFERYDIFTLDSLNILINYLDEEEKKEIYPPFKKVYKNKYKEVEREFEGINEYDFICKLLNFDIKDIIDDIDTLSKKELDFLNHIITVSLSKASKSEENYKMNNNLLECKNNIDLMEKYAIKNTTIDDSFTEEELEFLNHITKTANSKVSRTEKLNDKKHDDKVKSQEESDAYEKYSRHSNPLAEDFTDEELETYLKKYSIPDLKQFNKLLDLSSYEWNVLRLYKAYKKEIDNRSIYDEYNTEYDYQEALSKSKISDLKKDELTEKELKLLHQLVDTASMVLDSEYEDDTRELDILENSIIKKLQKK